MAYQFLSTILGINANFTGNVGVGTTTPATKLDVVGNVQSSGDFLFSAYNRSFASSSYPALNLYSSNIRSTQNIYSAGGTNGLSFYNNGSSLQFRIFDNGNVTVNSATDAGYKLDVNGTTRINSTLSLTNSSFAGTFNFYLSAANTMQASSSNIGTWLQVGGGNTVSIIGQAFNSTARGNSFGNTVGGEAISATTIIAQSSGTTATTGLSLRYTINNTGTYVGTTRGIYYNPTVTSLTGTTHYAIETVVGDVILGSTSGNVGIGTTTLGTATRLTLGGSQTASSAIARGGLVNTTLVAAANSDVLVGLDITPTFTNGAFTNVSNLAIRTNGNVQVRGNTTQFGAVFQVLDTAGTNNFYIRDIGDAFLKGTLWFGTLNGSTAMSSGYLSVYSGVGTGTSFITFTHNNGNVAFRALSNSVLQLNPSAGNVLIGTTTDAGYKLDVLGTIRAYNTSNGQSTIIIDTNGTSNMAAQLVFMQNSPNWSSQIGTHTSGGGLNYGLQFRSQASVVNMVMNRDGSNYFGGTFALASARVHIKGSGSTSATSSFLVQNSSSTELLRIKDDGNVSVGLLSGTGTRMVVADSTGTLSTQAVPTGTITGSGTTNYVSKWSSSSSLTNSVLYDDGTNVGIGTTTPNRKLTISNNGDALIGLNTITNGISTIGANFSGSFIVYDDTASTYRLVVKQTTGNVGIGTENPSWKLVVSDNGGAGLEINPNTSSNAVGIYSYDRINSAYRTLNLEASKYVFGVGNVLIGTSTDNGAKLQVNGDAYFGSFINSTFRYSFVGSGTYNSYHTYIVNTNSSNGTYGLGVNNYNTSSDGYILGLSSAGVERMIVRNDGNVGIGTSSPAQALDVNGLIRTNRTSNTDGGLVFGTAGTYLYGADSGGYLATYTSNVERMRVTSSGNVGIGTTSPSGLLDVSTGSVNITSYAYGLDLKLSVAGGFARANRIYNSLATGLTSFFGGYGDSTSGVTRAYWTIGNQTDDTGYSYTSGIHLLYNGNVGIGTANPNGFATTGRTILSLNGASNTLIEFKVGDAFQNYIYSTTSTFELYSSSIIDFQSLGASRLRIASSGNVLVGTTTDNGAKLQVSGRASIYTGASVIDAVAFTASDGSNALNYIPYVGAGDYNNLSYGGGSLLFNNISSRFTVGTHNGTAIQFGPTDTIISGTTSMPNLGGSGTRMVVADSTGTLSTQSIPGGGSSYGSWQDNNTQTATTNNTGYGIQFNTTNFNSGVTVIPDSLSALTLIKFANAGKYDIQFSFQFQNTSADDETVYIWIRKNGENTPDDVPDSNTIISIPKKHGSGTPGNTVAAWNLFVDAAPNDFYQLVWATSNATDVTMQYYGATGFCPATPSAILTVNQVD